jgi:hypothetical protein
LDLNGSHVRVVTRYRYITSHNDKSRVCLQNSMMERQFGQRDRLPSKGVNCNSRPVGRQVPRTSPSLFNPHTSSRLSVMSFPTISSACSLKFLSRNLFVETRRQHKNRLYECELTPYPVANRIKSASTVLPSSKAKPVFVKCVIGLLDLTLIWFSGRNYSA